MLGAARIAVIVPAYNEAALIAHTLSSIPPFVDMVVVVNDASRDHTSRCVTAFDDRRIVLINHQKNLGVGAAIRSGYQHAFTHGMDIAVVMAGDGQMHPADLPNLLKPLLANTADYAKGNRLDHPQVMTRMPTIRWLGNHILSRITCWITGFNVSDSQCGYTALARHAALRMNLDAMWPRYGYVNDLLGQCSLANIRVLDVTVQPVYGTEQSGVRLYHALFVIPYVLARVFSRRLLGYLSNPPTRTLARIDQLDP